MGRDLPAEFGPWQTVWERHRRFRLDGTRDRLLRKLLCDAGATGELDWQVSVDTSSPGCIIAAPRPGGLA